MITSFWEKIGSGLAETWNLRLLTPAFAFWAGGFILWAASLGWVPLYNIMQLDGVQASAVIIAALFLMALSSWAVSAMTLRMLRLFEGYWSLWPFNLMRSWLTQRLNNGWNKKFSRELQTLAKNFDHLDSIQRERFANLEEELLNAYPKDEALRLPTKLGNLLRFAEEYPQYFYGLQMHTIWPRLWLLLPEPTQKEISSARQYLDDQTRLLIWGMLFAVWSGLSWWATAIALLVALVACRGMYAAAWTYSLLLRSAYDLHRVDLYESLRWPLPDTPAAEKQAGAALTRYLYKGKTEAGFKFLLPK